MRKSRSSVPEIPTFEQISAERERMKYKSRYSKTFRSTVAVLVVVAAAAVLLATLLMPVLRIYGSSMVPTLEDGQIVVSLKTSKLETGDIVAFYHGNKLLVKRYIAGPSDWVNIDENGNIYVNNELVDEPYIAQKAKGETNIELPYQVPEGKYFFVGDNRKVSIDSRNTAVGCIEKDQVVGKIVFCVWPLKDFKEIK